MKMLFFCAGLAALSAVALAVPAGAGCVIAPDGKSINVVTDNPASEERNCAVSCNVDTKIGVVTVACGGNTPPLAKGHSLCDYDKPEAWYKKVISSEDSCKTAAGAAPGKAAAAPPSALKPGGFACRISPDGKSVDAVIVNPYKSETSCQIDCQLSTTKAGTTFSVSCGRNAAPGAEAVLCSHSVDSGRLVKMVGGKGECIDPTPKPEKAEKDDEVDVQSLIKSMPKPPAGSSPSAEEMEKMMNDPAKMQEFIRKQMGNP